MKQILAISVLSLALLGAGIWGFRSVGLAQQFEKRKHSLVDEKFSLVAHRGGALERPENTLASFDHATSLDPRIWIEFDVHLTKDGELVVIHDSTVDRTTNGKGRVQDLNLSELQELDAGYNFQDDKGNYSYRGKGLRIPTLLEVLTRYAGRRKVLEIKDEDEKAIGKTVDLVNSLKQQDEIVFASFHEKVIRSFRIKNPNWFYSTSAGQIQRTLILRSLWLLPVASFDGEFVMIPLRSDKSPIDVYDQDLHAELRRQAREVFIWIIDEPQQMNELLDKGVDGIITNSPTTLLSVLKQRGL